MRFSVDAHAIGRHLTGNEVYIRSLLQMFPSLDPDSEFTAYVSVDEPWRWLPASIRVKHVSQNPFKRLGWDIPRRLREDRPDLMHVQYTAPLGCATPLVVSVHDVSFLEHPEFFPPARRLQLQQTVPRTVARAAKILTPSEFSRKAILSHLPAPPEKVVVVPNGVSSVFRPVSRQTAQGEVKKRLSLEVPFVLMVGDIQPRKNQAGLVRAFAAALRAHPELPHHLVLAGKPGHYCRQVRTEAVVAGVDDRVHFTGFVSDEDLLWLYGACDMLAFPSFYEGFGIPILEAMACGRAVACSGASAMTEVADGAAILFDPRSTGEMARAILDLLLNTELRQRMERLGQQRAAHFSWERSAAKTLSVYYEVASAAAREYSPARTVPVIKS